MAISPIRELAPETALLTDRLSKLEKGETITYKELSALVGVNVQREGYSYLANARDRAQRLHGIVSHAVNNIGIQRLTAEGIAYETEPYRKRLKRMTRRYGHRSALVAKEEYDQLPTPARLSLDQGRTIRGLVKFLIAPKQYAVISSAISETQAPLPSRKFLELFAPKPKDNPKG
jgi:hypothetical protein